MPEIPQPIEAMIRDSVIQLVHASMPAVIAKAFHEAADLVHAELGDAGAAVVTKLRVRATETARGGA